MKLRPALQAVRDAQAEYHEKAQGLTSAQISEWNEKLKKLRDNVQAVLTEGAEPCKDCSNPPIGMFHDGTPRPFELGCPVCENHRVRATLPEDAVEDWNAGKFMPPREPGTAIMRHVGADGEVKSERVVRGTRTAR